MFEIEMHVKAQVGCFEVIQVGIKDYPVLIRKKPDDDTKFITAITDPKFVSQDSN